MTALIFAQPAWLALLLLAAPILWLHMRRRQTIIVGSVEIWRRVTGRTSTSRSRRLPPLTLPLVLQLAALALVALALARPVLVPAGGVPDHVIYVLDNSRDMLSRDAYGPARERLLATLGAEATAVAGTRYSVLLTTGPTQLLMARAPGDGLTAWLDLVPIAASAAAADWSAVAELASGVVIAGETTQLVLLGNDTVTDAGAAFADLTVETVHLVFGSAAPVAPEFGATRLEHRGDDWLLLGELVLPARGEAADAADPSASVALHLSFRALEDTAYLPWDTINLSLDDLVPADAEDGATRTTAALPFSVPVALPGSGVLRVDVGNDPGPLQQLAFAVHGTPLQAHILWLGEGDAGLLRALAAVPGTVLYTGGPEAADTAAFDLIVDNTRLGGAATSSLVVTPPGDDPLVEPMITWWSEAHPVAHGVSWSGLVVREAARMPVLPGAEVILEGNGLPLIQARTTPAGREVILAFSPDSSNWGELTSLPAFVDNVVRWAVPHLGASTPPTCEAGMPCILSPRLGGTVLTGEDGSEIRPVQVGPVVLDGVQTAATGVFWPAAQLPDVLPLVVNPAPAAVQTAVEQPDDGSAAPWQPPRPLWRPLLAAVILVLVAEAAVTLVPLRRVPVRGQALRRRRRALALRIAALSLAAVALFAPTVPLPTVRDQVVVVASADAGSQEVRSELLTAAASDPRGVGIVGFSQAGSVARDLGSPPGEAAFMPPAPEDVGANLALALATAQAMLDPVVPGRIVLASEGLQTVGDARSLLPLLAERGTAVDVLPLRATPPGEVFVELVGAPGSVYARDRFAFIATVTADAATSATISLLRDGESVTSFERELRPGRNVVEFLTDEPQAGTVFYEVLVEAAGDAVPYNDRQGVLIEVLPPAHVLVVTRQLEWGEVFADALRLHGMQATVVLPNRAPFYIYDWLRFSAYVLLDVPAVDLDTMQQELIETAVGEHGRGLFILGGPNSFGPGGYFETPLERVSPLSSRVPRDAPNVALAFVIDRSGSMQQSVGEGNRLDIAREATITAASLLHEESRVAIVAFDSDASVIVPLQERLDMEEIEAALRFLEPGGGTSLYPALVAAFQELEGVDAAASHIIVMSDGLSQPGDFAGILEQITAAGITVSTVAIGDGADRNNLQRYARLGGGAFHSTRDFRALPSILAQESLMLSGAPIEEYEVQPFWADRSHAFLEGVPTVVPAVSGFVLTTPKDAAAVHLQVTDQQGDDFPLLASWRFGSGRVLAFTSQAAGPWTDDWLTATDYPLLWAQTLRAFLPAVEREGINLAVTRAGDELLLTITLLDNEEEPLGGQHVTVNGVFMREASPGVYRGTLSATGTESLLVETGGAGTLLQPVRGGYPARYNYGLADSAVLELLADATGGQVLAGGDELSAGGHRYLAPRPVWPLLLLLALAAFLLELVTRYNPGIFRKEVRA